jgi:hypothetical protein
MERKTVPCYSHTKVLSFTHREKLAFVHVNEGCVGGKFFRACVMMGCRLIEDWLHIFFNLVSRWRLVICPAIGWLQHGEMSTFKHGIVGWTSSLTGVDTSEMVNMFRLCQEHTQNSACHPVHTFRRYVHTSVVLKNHMNL